MAAPDFVQRWRARVASAEAMRVEAGYRRRVGLLKVALPVSALALVAMVMAWSSFTPSQPSFRLDFTLSDLRGSGQDEVLNPRFFGTDPKGQPYTITAELGVRPTHGGDEVFLIMPEADIGLSNGEWMAVNAEQGIYDRRKGILRLSGAVSIYTDKGFEMHTESAIVNLAKGTARGKEAVRGQGPWGHLEAVGFRYLHGKRVFHFSGRPKLTLYPDSGEG